MDAAIATLFCEGISCAQCMGLGGGFLATVYDAGTKQVSHICTSIEGRSAMVRRGMEWYAIGTLLHL